MLREFDRAAFGARGFVCDALLERGHQIHYRSETRRLLVFRRGGSLFLAFDKLFHPLLILVVILLGAKWRDEAFGELFRQSNLRLLQVCRSILSVSGHVV